MAINPQLAMLFAQLAMSAGPQLVSSIMPKEKPVFKAPLGTVDYPVDDPRDWEQDIYGQWRKRPSNY